MTVCLIMQRFQSRGIVYESIPQFVGTNKTQCAIYVKRDHCYNNNYLNNCILIETLILYFILNYKLLIVFIV